MSKLARMTAVLSVAMVAVTVIGGVPACAAGDAVHDRDAAEALKALDGHTPAAGALARTAKGILVFPSIVKAGFLVGGQYGTGILFKQGRVAGHYNIAAVSYGFQAGVQTFAYALFFMTDNALAYLDGSEGFEVGVGPSIVVVDEGMGRTSPPPRRAATCMRSSSSRQG
jgi:lipid-binding SYLF domain-containing protein